MSAKEFNSVFFQLVLVSVALFVESAISQDIALNLNTKKVLAVTSDKFLSFTLDPAVLLTGDVLTSSTELSTNMAKALAPGYVRLAGPKSNSYNFERSLFPQNKGYEDPELMFSEAHWVLFQQWAQRAGLDVVSALTPQRIENEDQVTAWDPRNSLDLISFSDHMGYNISWQLGYECQIRCDIAGIDLGKDVTRLRNMLNAFPRYANSIIAGPDIVSFRGRLQQQFIQDYLNSAGNSLSAITWHPDFAGISVDSDGVALQMDTLAADRDLLYKSMGRSVAKKPLWIAESKPEECKRQFLGALVWARRLGNAAKLGIQVIMRQPDASNIFHPTPDYWVSLLHKMLVGKEVLDTKLTSGNKTHVHFYCQCTKPSEKYDRGAITIFGINLTPAKISVSLKGPKIKAVHKYILMPGYDTDNRMFAETVLLNNEPLTLVNEKTLPEINPAISLMGKNMALKLPSGGIGFWVIPGARVKSCLGHDEEGGDKNLLLKKLTRKLEEPEAAEENFGLELEDDNSNNNQDMDIESTEDIKSLLKSKKKKRKHWHSDETDDEDRRFKRIDTKKELEKLEKLLKRNSNNDEKKSPSHFKGKVGLAVFESEENKEENISDEDVGLVRFKTNEKPNSEAEIRAKFDEYKNKLIEYEMRKRNEEKNDVEIMGASSRRISQPEEKFFNDVDTQKALEALAVISKVEGTIRENEKSSEKTKYEEDPKRLKSLNLASDIGEEILIEELEKSDKSKRMIDPKYFDKIYQFLVGSSGDKIRKRSLENVGSDIREKRDLEKLLGDDPLGLRKEGLFKKRLKTDEAKERRIERRNRKKDKEEIGAKKELSMPWYDPKITDSIENNFFGIPPMKPLENFPEGDVFLDAGSSSQEKDHDYDYVRDDDDEETVSKHEKRNKNRRPKNKKQIKTVQDETWVEEPNSNLRHAPNEFFERINLPPVSIQTQWKDHSELYEPESLQPAGAIEEGQKAHEIDAATDTVIVKERLDEREDKKAKETAVKKLINYYDNSEVLRNSDQDFEREKQRPKGLKNRQKLRAETPIQRKPKERLKNNNVPAESATEKIETKRLFETDNAYEDSSDVGSLEFFNSKADEDYSEEIMAEDDDDIGVKKRTKRKIANLDIDIFGQEMIREDAGNSRDCKCRVIRRTGKLDCKNCRKSRRRQRDIAEIKSEDAVLDAAPDTVITDLSSIAEESTNYEVPTNVNEAPELKGEKSDTHMIEDHRDVVKLASESDDETSKKYIEVADLNGEVDKKEEEDFAPEIISEERSSAPESVGASTDDAGFQIVGSNQPSEPMSDLNPQLQVIGTDNKEGIEKEESNDDVVGSPRIIDEKNVDEVQETVEIQKNVDGENVEDENYSKHQIAENSEANLDAESGAKTSLNTGEAVLGSSLKTETRSEGKYKSGLEFKPKSGGLRSDSARSKLVLNTEALSALIKENESKKAEAMKAFETSSKLKSVDNTKFVEYQKKRAEKLASLKDKLRERKAKILQQYRQELLDALNKCDDEVERNLKRREIWDNFSNQQEFRDFIDKDKLAYLMMNRPVNYEHVEEPNNGFTQTEDRRYYPEIDMIQPVKSPRKQIVPAQIYSPGITQFSASSSQERDESSIEDIDTSLNDAEDETYYAIVESLENPKIFPKKYFEEYKNGLDENRKIKSNDLDYADGRILRRGEMLPKKYSDPRPEEPEHKHWRNHEEKPEKRIFADDGSVYRGGKHVLHVYGENLSPEYVALPYIQNRYDGNDVSLDQRALNEGEQLVRNARHSIPDEKQVLDEPAYKVLPANRRPDFSGRKERDAKENKSNYVCVREESAEDFGEDENRIFKLVKKEDYYEAVPISEFPEDSRAKRERKNLRRTSRNDEKVRNKRRKYSSDVLADEEGNFYVKDVGYIRRNLPKVHHVGDEQLMWENDGEHSMRKFPNKYKYELEGKSRSGIDEIDFGLIGDEINHVEPGYKLSPKEYELLMLIPVKRHNKVINRLKRDLDDNEIERSESHEDMSKFWDDIVDAKENENRLKEYVDAKDKTLRDFEEARTNLKTYLKKLASLRDPMQLEKLKKIILNLGSHDQDGMSVAAQSRDEPDRIHLDEFEKEEILKNIDDIRAGDSVGEKSTTPEVSSTSSNSPTLFDVALPKIESTINEGLEKVGNLTESLEDFINEFDQKFNATSEIESPEMGTENGKREEKISHNIFHTALNKVKKFFDFLAGVTLIFRRY